MINSVERLFLFKTIRYLLIDDKKDNISNDILQVTMPLSPSLFVIVDQFK